MAVEIRQFGRRQANGRLFVAADDDNLRAVDEFNIIERDLTGDDSSCGDPSGQLLHCAIATAQTGFRARDGFFNRDAGHAAALYFFEAAEGFCRPEFFNISAWM